jgi:ADP-ribosyl-[dinitrogen reductase] hydrolase
MTIAKPSAPSLSTVQADRAAGVLLGLACGDALGAGYEFQPARIHGEPVDMVGGGGFGWAPGEWTDDTSMAVAIAETSSTGVDLRSSTALDAITVRFVNWAKDAPDVGIQTGAVLRSIAADPTSAAAATSAREHFARKGRTGNGSLMRTAPVALAYLHDPEARGQAARSISGLTHGDDDAGDACALWCDAIAHAVIHGNLEGLRLALAALPADRARVWSERLDHAESVAPHEIPHNGWVVAALQAAWSAITRTPVPTDDPASGRFPAQHLTLALDTAVRAGDDTDTVAAIAGGLLGARWGASAIPTQWQRILHGWPGVRARDLIRLGLLTARAGTPDASGWPLEAIHDYSGYPGADALATHPHDSGVLLSGVGHLRHLPEGVDAVVSLCRLGADEVPPSGVTAGDHLEVWLVDSDDPAVNPNLCYVLTQAADAVAALRAEGRTVLLHCVQAQSRTPAVAARYSARHRGIAISQAFADVQSALPHAHPNATFRAALESLSPGLPAG